MDMVDRKVLSDIERTGWSDIAVFDPTNEIVPFNYTVGLGTLGHPELIIMGMRPDQLHMVLVGAVRLIQDEGERFTANTYSTEVLEGLRVAFLEVLEPLAEPYPMNMVAHLRGEFTALQMVWPDTNDRFPWHEDFEEKFEWRQKLLGPWLGES